MRMNFIKDRELALRFKNNAVPSNERLLYLLIFIIFMTAMSSTFVINNFYSGQTNQWDIYTDLSMIIMNFLGTLICYKTNKSGDNKEFIERYISIGFPVGIRT